MAGLCQTLDLLLGTELRLWVEIRYTIGIGYLYFNIIVLGIDMVCRPLLVPQRYNSCFKSQIEMMTKRGIFSPYIVLLRTISLSFISLKV